MAAEDILKPVQCSIATQKQ